MGQQGVGQCLGSERRTTDAKDEDVIKRLAHSLGEPSNLVDRVVLGPELLEAILTLELAEPDLVLHLGEPARQVVEGRAWQPMVLVEPVLEHPSVLQDHAGTSTTRPSYAGSIPVGSRSASSRCPVSWDRWVSRVRWAPMRRASAIASGIL